MGFLDALAGGVASGAVTGIVSGIFGASAQKRGNRLRAEELDFRRRQVARRSAEIDKFRSELTQRRQQFATRFAQLQSRAFERFVPKTEAMFAGRGLQVTGGAFQSELAKRVADLQAEQDVTQQRIARQDLIAEQNARAGAARLIPSTFDKQAGAQDFAAAGGFGELLGSSLPGALEGLGGSFSQFLASRRARPRPRSPLSGTATNVASFDLSGFGE